MTPQPKNVNFIDPFNELLESPLKNNAKKTKIELLTSINEIDKVRRQEIKKHPNSL